jgi:hypothetical protein
MTTFTDDFNRADGSPGANWVQVSGTWTIVSNRLSSGSAGGTIVIRAATAMATNDNSAQVTIATTGAVSHGVWARGNTTITQGYLWRNDGTSWNLFSVVGGSFVSIGSFAGAAVAGDVAKIQAVGSTIKGLVNGVVRVSVTDTAVTTGTSVGIRAESSNLLRFDDFTGADVTSGTTGDAALSGTATLSATGTRATSGSSALAVTAALSAAGSRTTASDAALSSTATLSAAGQLAAGRVGSRFGNRGAYRGGNARCGRLRDLVEYRFPLGDRHGGTGRSGIPDGICRPAGQRPEGDIERRLPGRLLSVYRRQGRLPTPAMRLWRCRRAWRRRRCRRRPEMRR